MSQQNWVTGSSEVGKTYPRNEQQNSSLHSDRMNTRKDDANTDYGGLDTRSDKQADLR